MRAGDAIRLVAWREIRTRTRTKAFRISTALVSAAVALLIVAPAVFGDQGPSTVTIAVPPDTVGSTFTSGAESVASALDVEVELVTTDDVRQLVADGDADVGLLSSDEALWNERVDETQAAVVRAGVQAVAIEQRSHDLGIAPADASTLLQPVELRTTTIEPPDPDRSQKVATAFIGVVLLFLAIQFHGAAVLQGVIEEKSSRVVEIVLTHIRASQLLAGKTVGIGVVGLLQAAVVATVALVASMTVEGADVPQIGVAQVAILLFWFVLGFLLYATGFATAGSLVSRQEDAQAATAPLALPFLAAYIASLSIADNPDSTVGRVLSIFPLTAPLAMPVRMAAGDPPVIEVVAGAVLTVATIAALTQIGGAIYRRNLLRTGARVPWREALRGIRADPTDT